MNIEQVRYSIIMTVYMMPSYIWTLQKQRELIAKGRVRYKRGTTYTYIQRSKLAPKLYISPAKLMT